MLLTVGCWLFTLLVYFLISDNIRGKENMSNALLQQALGVFENMPQPIQEDNAELMSAMREALYSRITVADWAHPDIKLLLEQSTRHEIEMSIINDMVENPYFEKTPTDLMYWTELHTKLESVLALIPGQRRQMPALFRARADEPVNEAEV